MDNPQFTSDKASDPKELAREAQESESRFLELQWHLLNSLDIPGCRVVNDTRRPLTPPHGAGE